MDYRNEKHRAVFEDFIRKKDRNNQAICFEQVRLHGTNTNSYPLFCAAKDLYLGTRNLTVSELADKSLVTPKVFGLICNAMAIRRFGLGAIQHEVMGGM